MRQWSLHQAGQVVIKAEFFRWMTVLQACTHESKLIYVQSLHTSVCLCAEEICCFVSVLVVQYCSQEMEHQLRWQGAYWYKTEIVADDPHFCLHSLPLTPVHYAEEEDSVKERLALLCTCRK